MSASSLKRCLDESDRKSRSQMINQEEFIIRSDVAVTSKWTHLIFLLPSCIPKSLHAFYMYPPTHTRTHHTQLRNKSVNGVSPVMDWQTRIHHPLFPDWNGRMEIRAGLLTYWERVKAGETCCEHVLICD